MSALDLSTCGRVGRQLLFAVEVELHLALFAVEVELNLALFAAEVRPEVALFALCRRVYVAVTEIEHRRPAVMLQ